MEKSPDQTFLSRIFRRNGCLRLPDPARLGDEKYKKGYELRLVADDIVELNRVRRALERQGFDTPKAYAKNEFQWVQPLYGRARVEQFLRFCKLGLPANFTTSPTAADAARTFPSPPSATACGDAR